MRRRLVSRMDEAIGPAGWAVDDTGWLKCGTASPGVAWQYTGTAGKVTNCQIGVSLNLVTDVASCPVGWRLLMPESWDPCSAEAAVDVGLRRARAQVSDDVGYREKWRLGLDMIDEVIGWGLRPPVIVADAGYGDSGEFRHGLTQRGPSYLVQVATTIGVQQQTAVRTAPPANWTGRPPALRYRAPAVSVKDLILSHPPPPSRCPGVTVPAPARAGR